jgi:TatD DNase family protein
MLPAIDAHAHIDVRIQPRELEDLGAAVLAVTRSIEEWRLAAMRADELTLWGIGCHPGLPEAIGAFRKGDFDEALRSASFVGEVGLDRRSRVPMDRQIEVLTAVLTCVQRTPRPVTIHSTGATRLVLELLENHPIQGAILHWWRGTESETRKAIELSCFFSLNGHEVANPKTIDLIPPERVLTETDFPHSTRFDPGATHPAATMKIERALMERHRLTLLELRERLWANLRATFSVAPGVVPVARRVGQLLATPNSLD